MFKEVDMVTERGIITFGGFPLVSDLNEIEGGNIYIFKIIIKYDKIFN